jgi:hypothetical protein
MITGGGGGASAPLTLTGKSDTAQFTIVGNSTQTTSMAVLKRGSAGQSGALLDVVDETGTALGLRVNAAGRLLVDTIDGFFAANVNFGHGATLASGIGVWGHAVPGAQPGAIAAPTAPSAAYVQAEAQSMKTAVDAIRAALSGCGITA